MPVTKTWAGGTYNLPLNREPKGSWGTEVSNFLISLATNAVALTGGTQTLSAELNFGAAFGLVAPYIKSASANIAAAGMVRLAKTDTVAWRNNANNADLALGINGSDQLTFAGTALQTSGNYVTALTGDVTATGPGSAAATVAQVGGKTAAAVAQSVTDTTAATNTNTVSTIVKRDGSGNFSAGTITAALSGNATTATTAGNVSGTVAIANGGTGQTAKTAAFNALSPLTTKGDLTSFDGTNGVRVAVGADGTVLSADSSQAAGLKWISPLTNPMTAVQDLIVGGTAGAANRLPTSLLGSVQASVSSQTATITIATPGVLTVTTAPATGATFYLTTTGALPTGLAANTTYYAINTGATTFKAATTLGNALAGTAIATSGSQSGTHTLFTGGLTVGANGIPGNISGSAIATGYVGEVVRSSNWAQFSLSTSEADVTGASITLPAGAWRVHYSVSMDVTTGATSGNASEGTVKITDSSNVLLGTSQRGLFVKTTTNANNEITATLTAEELVYTSSSITYKLRAILANGSGVGSGSVQSATNAANGGIFYAVRIA